MANTNDETLSRADEMLQGEGAEVQEAKDLVRRRIESLLDHFKVCGIKNRNDAWLYGLHLLKEAGKSVDGVSLKYNTVQSSALRANSPDRKPDDATRTALIDLFALHPEVATEDGKECPLECADTIKGGWAPPAASSGAPSPSDVQQRLSSMLDGDEDGEDADAEVYVPMPPADASMPEVLEVDSKLLEEQISPLAMYQRRRVQIGMGLVGVFSWLVASGITLLFISATPGFIFTPATWALVGVVGGVASAVVLYIGHAFQAYRTLRTGFKAFVYKIQGVNMVREEIKLPAHLITEGDLAKMRMYDSNRGNLEVHLMWHTPPNTEGKDGKQVKSQPQLYAFRPRVQTPEETPVGDKPRTRGDMEVAQQILLPQVLTPLELAKNTQPEDDAMLKLLEGGRGFKGPNWTSGQWLLAAFLLAALGTLFVYGSFFGTSGLPLGAGA